MPLQIMRKKWLVCNLLILVGLLTPELIARLLFPHHGLTFAESIAYENHLERVKTPEERRVFIFGASSVVGYHHLGRSSFSIAIQYILSQLAPGISWKVVNFGKPGEGSRFVFDAVKETYRYQPDLVLIYTGESEFAPIPVLRHQARYELERFLLKSKAFRVAREWVGLSPWPSVPDFKRHRWSEVTEEVQAHRDDIIRSFEDGGRTLWKSKPTRTGWVLLEPLLSLETGPSFYDEIDKWELNYDRPGTLAYIQGVLDQEAGHPAEAVRRFRAALSFDDKFAPAHQRLGLCLLALGNRPAAEAEMVRAAELDPIPRRPLHDSYERILEGCSDCTLIPLAGRVASHHGTAYVPEALIEDGCHATVPLEYEESQIIMDDPYVQKRLGLRGKASEIPYERYRIARGFNARYFSDIDLRLVRYFDGRLPAEHYLRHAASTDFNNPDLPAAIVFHRQHHAHWRKQREAMLNLWTAELRRRKGAYDHSH
jgi:tetratricopeptide (TPR) repeat protein